jgi:uncharacterized protein (DUF58 family)
MPALARQLRASAGLTSRAWTFIASGVGLMLGGLVASVAPLVQLGALLLLLPVAATLLTRPPGGGLTLERRLSARELASGDHLHVTVTVRGRFPRGRSVLLEDLADPGLGGAHRFAVDGLTGQAISRPHYRVRVGARGVHHLGPMRLHVVDRFGMVHRVITVAGREEVLVTPRVTALDPLVLGGASVGRGTGHVGPLGAATDDVIPREYHPGDEVRRIDWKASARTGSLMVRSEESPWRAAVTLVVDLREADHHGHDPDSSVDAMLELAASIGCLALAAGWDCTVRTTDDVGLFAGSPMSGVEAERRELLRALATAPLSSAQVPAAGLRRSVDTTSSGPLVLLLGSVPPPSARLLAGVGPHRSPRMCVWLATEQWGRAGDGGPGRAALTAESLAHFTAAGWRVARMERDSGPAATWAALVGAP